MMSQTNAVQAAPSQYVAANGLNVHYKEWGSGYPLILLHGGTANLESWSEQIPLFAPHFRVIAPDTRGHGLTENPSNTLTYQGLADDTAAFIGALRLDRPFLFGYSDGGQIALDLGIRYPDVAGALVLGGTVYQFGEAYFDTLRGWGMTGPGNADLEAMARSDEGWIDYLKSAHPRPNDPDYWRRFIQEQISTLWWTTPTYTPEDLAKIAAPTLIMAGDRDFGIEWNQLGEMYRGIPNAELLVVPNANHGEDINDRAMAFVVDFLKRHTLTETAA